MKRVLLWMDIQFFSIIVADQNTQAFKEVAIIRHPRIGEYAFGFITSFVSLQVCHAFHVFGYRFPHLSLYLCL